MPMFASAKQTASKLAILGLLSALGASDAHAQYFSHPESVVNPAILQIDERAVLGRSLDPQTELIDQDGRNFRWGDLAGKPTLLVLSYYTCDGSCGLINANLHDLLGDVTRYKPGVDFNLVTLSFDHRDNRETTNAFRKNLGLSDELASAWTFATFKNEADVKTQTAKIGFKFFWSPQDGLFLHPGVYLFFSPEGRLDRVLYREDIGPKDVELALLDAREGKFRPNEVIDYAFSLCYSYSYRDGKYRLSIPLFVGLGALATGLLTLAGSVLSFRLWRQNQLRRA
ncbi:MAG: SCO family protein [Roseiarcus sp.]